MLTGHSSTETLIPGDSSAITTAVETAGAGAGAARDVSHAWQIMTIPSWQGRAASGWQSFTPQEAARVEQAPGAFNRVASALLRYQAALRTARAETEMAIAEAAASEQITTNAIRHHQTALRTAALAQPGTPETLVAPFSDPGAASLFTANQRYEIARSNLNTVGDEVASEIHSAAGTTTGEDVGIEWWDQILQFPNKFLWDGVGGQIIDTAVGVWEILPGNQIIDDVFNSGDNWWEQYGEMWGGIIDGIVSDPLGALGAVWGDFIAADHWDEYAGEGVGRVFFNVASLFVGGAGIIKSLKVLKTVKPVAAVAVSLPEVISLLKSSKGITIAGDRVIVGGIDKMSVTEFAEIYGQSVHNMDASEAVLGKFQKGDTNSYEQVAIDNGAAHFNLDGTKWPDLKSKYDLTDAEMYELLNKPFLSEIIEKKIPVKFTVDPRGDKGALGAEFEFLTDNGYRFSPSTLVMQPKS